MTTWQDMLNLDDSFSFKRIKTGALISTTTTNNNNKKPNISQCDSIYDRDEEYEVCFGCEIIAECDYGAIDSEDIIALMTRVRKCIGKVNPRALARDIARRYAIIQEKVNAKGKDPLPDWTEDGIMNHWLYHNVDPELQAWLRMWESQRITQCALKAMFVKNDDTGAEYIDEKQNKIYNAQVEKMESLSRSDPTQKQYYSGGAYLNSKTVSEGSIVYSGKTINNYFKRQRK